MFGNFIKSAFRALWRQKLFAFINIFGLAIGLTACMILILFVRHELDYDNFFADSDRIYRMEATANIPGRPSNDVATYVGPTYDLLPADYSEVEQVIRLQPSFGAVVKEGERFDENLMYTDTELFDVFDFPFVEGSGEGTFNDLHSVVLTREMAIKHLGEAPWLGKTLKINDVYERELTVTGVIEDLPANTHFAFDILLPHDPQVYGANNFGGANNMERWNGLPFFVYVKLFEGNSIDNMKATINDWVDKYFPENISRLVQIKGSELFTPRFVAVPDIHMYSPAIGDMKPHGSLTTIYAYSAIAGLILLIACINFVNLSMARSTLRAREIAMRKVVGASRNSLFWQFQMETLFFSFLALLLAAGMTELILPQFSDYTGREITSGMIFEPLNLFAILALTAAVGLLAGMHPALVLSGLRPARILRSNKSGVGGTSFIRKSLTLLQFTISAALIIMTGIIYIQIDFEQNRDLGYDRTDKVIVRGLGDPQVGDGVQTILEEARKIPGVQEASLASFAPGDGIGAGMSLVMPGESERLVIFFRSVNADFLPQFDVKMLAGRNFQEDVSGDRARFPDNPDPEQKLYRNVLVNMAAARRMGFGNADEAVGKQFNSGQNNQVTYTIVGVMPDIHFVSPRVAVDAEIYMYDPDNLGTLVLSVREEDGQAVGEAVDAMINGMYPGVRTFRQYVSENIAGQFQEERVQNTLVAIFSGLAILVACMGLFGLAAFSMARRTKEIGIRKVMGASPGRIISMLISQFARPILISNLIAWPIAWWAAGMWLEPFIYRIDLLPWFSMVIIVAAFLTLMIGSVTVLAHAVRVSRANPVHALHYE